MIDLTANAERAVSEKTRREFLRAGARYALLSAITAGTLAVGARSVRAPADQACINQSICRGCARMQDCELPQALSTKRARRERKGLNS